MLDKIDELETIMLGEEKDDPKYAWLKNKFDALRDECYAEKYPYRSRKYVIALIIGCSYGSALALFFHHFLFGCW